MRPPVLRLFDGEIVAFRGRVLPHYVQVRMVGNSVPPQFVNAIVRANFAVRTLEVASA